MKFRQGQRVRIIDLGQIRTIIWVDLFTGKFYRLDNKLLYTEEELEAIEED